MTLTISPARAPRTRDELLALIAAIRAASPTDEVDAVEWKCPVEWQGRTPDVASKAWMAKHVARTVIGMANRDPDFAGQSFEGCGYLVMGASPDGLDGVAALDPAAVDDKLTPYLGRDGPRCKWENVDVEGKNVAVVIVEAPRWGDPIHTLRKAYEELEEGTIFVRRPGKTERPRTADIRALTERARRAADRLDMGVRWADPVPLMPALAVDEEQLDAWVHDQLQEMLNDADGSTEVHDLVQRKVGTLAMAMAAAAIEPEQRSLEEYRQQVARWGVATRAALKAAVRHRVASEPDRQGLTPVLLNNTERNFVAVGLDMYAPGDVTAHVREGMSTDHPTLPARPRRFGPARKNFALGLPNFKAYPFLGRVRPAEVWVDNSGSATIRFATVNLRPHHSVDLSPIWLVGGSALAGALISLSWTATATNVDGAVHGALEVGFQKPALDIAEVLAQRVS